jgi:hypothetical protein
MLKAYCRYFGHHRSERHRRRAGALWQSRCVSCAAPLVRLDSGEWVELSSPAGREAIKAAERMVLRPVPTVAARESVASDFPPSL